MNADNVATTLYFGPWYRRSPFFEATLRAGCKAYDIYNHMYLPGYYGDPIEEYWHLLEHVTLWDVGVERVIQISGPDALAFTNMLTCRDLTRCAVGQGKYAPLLTADGGIINDPVLLRVAEDRFWLCLADSDAGLWARGVALGAGLDVTIDEPPVYPVQIQGPKAKPLVRDLLGDDIAGLRYYFCADTALHGIPVTVSRTGWTGEVGYEVYLRDPDRGDDLWNAIMTAGEPYQIRPIAPCEARRIEAGIFNYNSGMERLVEPQEADYVGKAALERVRADGVTRKLVGIEVVGDPLEFEISAFWPAYRDGSQVGHVTDLVWSPRLRRNIGYVWVPVELAAPGTTLRIEAPKGAVTGQTAAIPFLDPTKKVPVS